LVLFLRSSHLFADPPCGGTATKIRKRVYLTPFAILAQKMGERNYIIINPLLNYTGQPSQKQEG